MIGIRIKIAYVDDYLSSIRHHTWHNVSLDHVRYMVEYWNRIEWRDSCTWCLCCFYLFCSLVLIHFYISCYGLHSSCHITITSMLPCSFINKWSRVSLLIYVDWYDLLQNVMFIVSSCVNLYFSCIFYITSYFI